MTLLTVLVVSYYAICSGTPLLSWKRLVTLPHGVHLDVLGGHGHIPGLAQAGWNEAAISIPAGLLRLLLEGRAAWNVSSCQQVQSLTLIRPNPA